MHTILDANKQEVGTLYLGSEINAMIVGASAHPDNQIALRNLLGKVEGFFYLYADGRITDSASSRTVGYWR